VSSDGSHSSRVLPIAVVATGGSVGEWMCSLQLLHLRSLRVVRTLPHPTTIVSHALARHTAGCISCDVSIGQWKRHRGMDLAHLMSMQLAYGNVRDGRYEPYITTHTHATAMWPNPIQLAPYTSSSLRTLHVSAYRNAHTHTLSVAIYDSGGLCDAYEVVTWQHSALYLI